MLYGAIAASELRLARQGEIQQISADFAGLGALTASAFLANPLQQGTANFAGIGNLNANSTVVENPVKQGSVAFSGLGSFNADSIMLEGSVKQASAIFAGSGLFGIDDSKITGTMWTPGSLASLVGWWDASDTATLTDAGSGHCSQWNDKSSNANHPTQATDGNRPIITASGINGLTVLAFSTDSQNLEKSSASGLPSLATGMGFGVVALADGNLAGRCLWDITDTANTTNRTMQEFFYSNITLRSQNANAATATYSDLVNAHLTSGTISTTLRDVYVDGTQGSSNSTTQSSLNSVHFRIGELFQDVYPFHGKIGEIVWFSGTSSTERQLVEGYLAWKWGLQANLPVGHPYKTARP